MKTLHLYLTRQILVTLVMTVLVFTFILLLGNLKNILSLLLNGQAGASIVLQAIGLLIPFVLVFALPMAMLTATLLVFGRFSADQELTAVRASGVSLISLITPILFLSISLSAVCAWVNLQLGPECRAAYKNLYTKLAFGSAKGFLQEEKYIEGLEEGYTLYMRKFEKESADTYRLKDVYIHQANEKDNSTQWFQAPTGTLVYDTAAKTMSLTLFDAYGSHQQGTNINPVPYLAQTTIDLTPKPQKEKDEEPKLSDMTFLQLREKISELRAKGISAARAEVQVHRMVSFSFACIGFTLIGIPLGVRAHRRETSIGIAIALGLVLLYYSFIILGQSLESRPEPIPQLIIWLPNFIFQIVGGSLLWRANKGM